MTSTAQGRGWVPDLDSFGARLALIRQHFGWNVKEAALACDLPPQSWRNWEAGTALRDPVRVVQAIADRTGVDRDWLLWGHPGSGSTIGASCTPPRGVSRYAMRAAA